MGAFASPFVQPRVARLPLDDGQWIEIKHELSYGDMQVFASQTRGDLSAASLNLVAAYLLESFLTQASQLQYLATTSSPLRSLREPCAFLELALTPESLESRQRPSPSRA